MEHDGVWSSIKVIYMGNDIKNINNNLSSTEEKEETDQLE